LFDAQAPIYSDKLPELLDVRLMAMSPLAFTLTGFERVAGVEYAQSWLVSNFGRAESGRFCLARVVRQRYSVTVRVRPILLKNSFSKAARKITAPQTRRSF